MRLLFSTRQGTIECIDCDRSDLTDFSEYSICSAGYRRFVRLFLRTTCDGSFTSISS